MPERSPLSAGQILEALQRALHEYGTETRDLFPEKDELEDEELFSFVISALINFFSGQNRAWFYLPVGIRTTLQELADPDITDGSKLDVRDYLTGPEKTALIQGLQALR